MFPCTMQVQYTSTSHFNCELRVWTKIEEQHFSSEVALKIYRNVNCIQVCNISILVTENDLLSPPV